MIDAAPEGLSERERITYRLGMLSVVIASQADERDFLNLMVVEAFKAERDALLNRLAASAPYSDAQAEAHCERVLLEEMAAS